VALLGMTAVAIDLASFGQAHGPSEVGGSELAG
jgi:hypothetical protein